MGTQIRKPNTIQSTSQAKNSKKTLDHRQLITAQDRPKMQTQGFTEKSQTNKIEK